MHAVVAALLSGGGGGVAASRDGCVSQEATACEVAVDVGDEGGGGIPPMPITPTRPSTSTPSPMPLLPTTTTSLSPARIAQLLRTFGEALSADLSSALASALLTQAVHGEGGGGGDGTRINEGSGDEGSPPPALEGSHHDAGVELYDSIALDMGVTPLLHVPQLQQQQQQRALPQKALSQVVVRPSPPLQVPAAAPRRSFRGTAADSMGSVESLLDAARLPERVANAQASALAIHELVAGVLAQQRTQTLRARDLRLLRGGREAGAEEGRAAPPIPVAAVDPSPPAVALSWRVGEFCRGTVLGALLGGGDGVG